MFSIPYFERLFPQEKQQHQSFQHVPKNNRCLDSSDKPSSSHKNYDSYLLGAKTEVRTVVLHCYRVSKSAEGCGWSGWMIDWWIGWIDDKINQNCSVSLTSTKYLLYFNPDHDLSLNLTKLFLYLILIQP